MFAWFLVFLISVSQADHVKKRGRGRAAGRSLCVCQYQAEPRTCGGHRDQDSCLGQRDCMWLTDEDRCTNWHQSYCETALERGRLNGCTDFRVITDAEDAPVCEPGISSYQYMYQGHGPRFRELAKTIRRVVDESGANRCRFSFRDEACSSFELDGNEGAPDGLATVRHFLQRMSARLAPGQRLTVTGNQNVATGTIVGRHDIRSPSYTFEVTDQGIASETPVGCDVPPVDCNARRLGNRYLCSTGTGIRTRVCCSNLLSYAWRDNARTCE